MRLREIAACPTCMQLLASSPENLSCSACGTTYPVINGLPWLLPDPDRKLWEWRGRVRLLHSQIDSEVAQLRSELANALRTRTAQRRLSMLAEAKSDHIKKLNGILSPLISTDGRQGHVHKALGTPLPGQPGITRYFHNFHRDWAWRTGENQASLSALEKVIDPSRSLGWLLVLGAGAGRLAYDLHLARKPDYTLISDVNPLLLFGLQKILAGEVVELYEFPIVPRELEHSAILRRCFADGPLRSELGALEIAFVDALRPAFLPGQFDTVLTPWLIDILPSSFAGIARQVNALLRPGGVWLNLGSLAFGTANHSLSAELSFEEVLEEVEASGFAVPDVHREQLPYMQSPASSHGRLELVTAFAAKKTRDLELASSDAVVAWLQDRALPVPRSTEIDALGSFHHVLAGLVALIDGKRSVRDLSLAFASNYGLPPLEAEAAICGFLARTVSK